MDWKDIAIRRDASIRNGLEVIDSGGIQIALVIDQNARLLGVVTDGDIRRGILQGIDLDVSVTSVMNPDPVTASPDETRVRLIETMKSRRIHQIPVVDTKGTVQAIKVLDELLEPEPRPNPVMLMAGGLGKRLRPLTDDCPKPLLKVGDKPILETIIKGFIQHGFNQFYLSINYKAGMIENYFGDGSNWNVQIEYIREEKRLGTAGPLSLLPRRPEHPLVVMNGDLLTTLNFSQLVDFHEEQQANATMCVREYEVQVPYGVVQTEDQLMTALEEKPVHRHFVNAGIYVLNPEVVEQVPSNSFYDMPDLFEKLVEGGKKAAVFPVREYWQDVGQKEDFHRANGEYDKVFA
jgi:dTDP-glucose pyrophosphorylase